MIRHICIKILVLTAVCACAPEAEGPTEPAIRPAKLVTVEAVSNRTTISFPAVVRASRSTQLAFEVGGKITELNIIESTIVEPGQILAQLEERDYANRLTQAQSEYDNAQSAFQRARRLSEQDAISKSVLDSRRAQRDIAKAALDTAQKAFDDTTLKAPYGGVISVVNVKQFQNIQPLEPIATVQSDGVEVLLNAPATFIAYTPQLTPVSAKVILDVAPNQELPAILKEAGAEADPATQTYEVSFSFTPPEELLILPGMTATLVAEVEISDLVFADLGGFSVPRSAILAEGEELYVWVVSPDDQSVSKKPVAVREGIGENLSDNVIISSGLKDGDVIVAAGGSFLHQGMKVRPWKG